MSYAELTFSSKDVDGQFRGRDVRLRGTDVRFGGRDVQFPACDAQLCGRGAQIGRRDAQVRGRDVHVRERDQVVTPSFCALDMQNALLAEDETKPDSTPQAKHCDHAG